MRTGDQIEWLFGNRPELSAAPEDIPLDILWEDGEVAIVNKAAGMVVHPAPGHPTGTLVNAIMHHFDLLAEGTHALRPGIVHRIDKDTSGAIVVTKTDAAHQHLAALFATHDIEREYHALVVDAGLQDRGTFETLHGRHPTDRVRFSTRVNRGRRAVTHYEVLQRYTPSKTALVRCTLETGRTHQIRVHFADVHAPLLGDRLYAPNKVAMTLRIDRQALHARTLGFRRRDGTSIRVEAPYPDDFQTAVDALRDGARI